VTASYDFSGITKAKDIDNDDVEINGEDAPVPALKLKQVKDFMRQKAKEKKLSAETLTELKTAFE